MPGLLAVSAWVPPASALFVALVAAIVSYCVTWRFKRADIDRDNGIRAADLVDEAERIASWRDRFDAQPEGGASATLRLLQQARVRAEPLDDSDLADRFRAAVSFNSELQTWPDPTSQATHWLTNAIVNVRKGLVPHLAAPKLIPEPGTPRLIRIGRVPERERTFPTASEYNAMPNSARDGSDLLDALVKWRANRANPA
jgi:hypothetical protein